MIKVLNAEDFNLKEYRNKSCTSSAGVSQSVAAIIDDVRANGDKALFSYIKKFDGYDAEKNSLVIEQDQIKESLKKVDSAFLKVLKKTKENIEEFHKNQIRSGFVHTPSDGVVMGQKVLPIAKVGLYVPGGTASYPSSVLMNAVPANLAGVGEVAIATPCRAENGGEVPLDILAAAAVAGVKKIYKMGGAQAIAALAYGTESVAAVDKIVGPGNAYVAEAKRQVFGQVGIDMIAGPSEILIVADDSASPGVLAADLLSQAEHDRAASAILLTTSESLAKQVSSCVEEQINQNPRAEIARASVDNNGLIVICKNIKAAIELSNTIAPEHLELQVAEPFNYLGLVKNAGSVFLGANTPESLGDYMAGANHVLPTSGSARFSSALGVDDFTHKVQFTYFNHDAFDKIAGDVAFFAKREGLFAHAASAIIRSKNK